MLDPRFDLRRHSPDGFEWGYAGSGPAQLALAICAEVLNDDARAQLIYQDVQARLIQYINQDDWTLSEDTIRAAIEKASHG